MLVERGSFRPPTLVNIDMLESALEKFEADPAVEGHDVLALTELTMRNLLAGGADVDRRDFLARADLLAACGMTVLISDYFDYYRLAAYIGERTDQRIGIVMGVPSLIDLFDEKQPRPAARRHPRELRPAVQERPEALRLSGAARPPTSR